MDIARDPLPVAPCAHYLMGGVATDLAGRTSLPGLYAAGEVAGFGGGGYHGWNALEGTFLGGCIFSGRTAGRSV